MVGAADDSAREASESVGTAGRMRSLDDCRVQPRAQAAAVDGAGVKIHGGRQLGAFGLAG